MVQICKMLGVFHGPRSLTYCNEVTLAYLALGLPTSLAASLHTTSQYTISRLTDQYIHYNSPIKPRYVTTSKNLSLDFYDVIVLAESDHIKISYRSKT